MSSVRGSICHLDRAMNRVRACYEHPERAWRQSMEKRRAWRQSGMETERAWRQRERFGDSQREYGDRDSMQRERERERERVPCRQGEHTHREICHVDRENTKTERAWSAWRQTERAR